MDLSPGTFYRDVPTDPEANLDWRKFVIEEAAESPRLRAELIEACRRDICFWVNTFAWQYNPNKKGRDAVGPFVLWPFQRRALLSRDPARPGILWCYQHDKTAVVEKSREMGATWLFLLVEDWLCLFHRHVQAFNISRSADAVDAKTRNSLFAKLRFLHQHMPDWLKGSVEDTKFHFDFGRSKSEITGEASTGRAGSGGRASVVFVDEFPEIKEDVKVRQNTASISNSRFFNGTHLGVGTEFYNLTQTPEISRLQFHWTRHPDKNKGLYSWDVTAGAVRFWRYDDESDEIMPLVAPEYEYPSEFEFDTTGKPAGGPHPGLRSPWYDRKCIDIGTARGVAMELDIDPAGSASQFYEPLLIRRLVGRAEEPHWRGGLDFSDGAVALTESTDGPLALWLRPGLDATGSQRRLPRFTYTLGVDLGWGGGGGNPSCLSVFDASRGRKVAEYVRHDLEPKEFARHVIALAGLWLGPTGERPLLAWEIPGPGNSFGAEVKELGYGPVYRHVDPFADDDGEEGNPGWVANPQSKLYLHTEYQKALAGGLFTNPSAEALKECLAFHHTANGSVEHPRMKPRRGDDPATTGLSHGDRVVADGLAWLMALRLGLGVVKPSAVADEPLDVYSIAGMRKRRERMALAEEEAWL